MKENIEWEVIAKLLGARASCPQILEKCGLEVPVPGKVAGGICMIDDSGERTKVKICNSNMAGAQ